MDFITIPIPATADPVLVADIRRLPLNMERGAWVAGGAARALLTGEAVRDIDVFGSTATSLFRPDRGEAVYRWMKQDPSIECSDKRSNDLETRFRVDKRVTYQIIKRWTYDRAEDLIADFDFSVCQFATDGRVILTRRGSLDDLAARRLRALRPPRDGKLGAGRLRRYILYGFVPDPDTIWMMADLDDVTDFDQKHGTTARSKPPFDPYS